jgi:hypothetical protein
MVRCFPLGQRGVRGFLKGTPGSTASQGNALLRRRCGLAIRPPHTPFRSDFDGLQVDVVANTQLLEENQALLTLDLGSRANRQAYLTPFGLS